MVRRSFIDLRSDANNPYDTAVQGCNPREDRARSSIHLTPFLLSGGLCLSCISWCLCLLGCVTPPNAGKFSVAVSRYEEGRYAAALAEGESLMRNESTAIASQGALIGAMSAYKLGQFDRAEKLALRAGESLDGSIAGAALVVLGDVRLSQNRPVDAAGYYSQAALKLQGADANRAQDCARRSLEVSRAAVGPVDLARGMESDIVEDLEIVPAPAWTLTSKTSSPALAATTRIEETTTSKRPNQNSVASKSKNQPTVPVACATRSVADRLFTIRAGSYSSQSAAEKRAKDLANDLMRSKSPLPRIDPIHTSKGEELFAVRIGSWKTRAEAEKVLNAIARRDLMVGAIDPE